MTAVVPVISRDGEWWQAEARLSPHHTRAVGCGKTRDRALSNLAASIGWQGYVLQVERMAA